MEPLKIRRIIIIAVLTFFVLWSTHVLAQVEATDARGVTRVFALTTSDSAIYSNSSGAFELMPSTELTINLRTDSMLVITFSARGSVAPPSDTRIPIVFVKCEIDGIPAEPNFNSVEFLYPQFCCDTRSFTWVVHSAEAGTHTIKILWGMGNPTLAVVTNRTLVVEAARLPLFP